MDEVKVILTKDDIEIILDSLQYMMYEKCGLNVDREHEIINKLCFYIKEEYK